MTSGEGRHSPAWKVIEMTMVVLMAIMIVLVFINVVMRYGLNSGIIASAEVSRFLFVWITMLSAIICMRDGTHLDLRLVETYLPPRIVRIQRRIVYAVIVLTSGMLLTGSFTQVISNWSNASPLSGLPTGLFYLAGVVAGAGIAAIALYRLIFPDTEPSMVQKLVE